jgi:hypothetical protein
MAKYQDESINIPVEFETSESGEYVTKTSGVAIRHHSIIDPGKPSVGGLFENTIDGYMVVIPTIYCSIDS